MATQGDPSVWVSPPLACGVSRWQRLDSRWQPVEFVPVVRSREAADPQVVYGQRMPVLPMEPSLIRDVDGALLLSARGVYDEADEHAIRVWRSTDGQTWDLVIDIPEVRGQAPVTINQAAKIARASRSRSR